MNSQISSTSIKINTEKYLGYLRENWPKIFEFKSKITESELDIIEEILKCKIPEVIRDFYLSIPSYGYLDLAGFMVINSFDQLKNEIEHLDDFYGKYREFSEDEIEVGSGIKSPFRSPKWLPIFTTGAGDTGYIDLDPPLKIGNDSIAGTFTQIIYNDHEKASFVLVSKSFDSLLESYLLNIEQGKIKFSKNTDLPSIESPSHEKDFLNLMI